MVALVAILVLVAMPPPALETTVENYLQSNADSTTIDAIAPAPVLVMVDENLAPAMDAEKNEACVTITDNMLRTGRFNAAWPQYRTA